MVTKQRKQTSWARWLYGLCLAFCLAVSPKAFADWTNADSYGTSLGYWVTHVPTLDQPYYTIRYPSLDEGGTDDYLMLCRLYAGSDKSGYATWLNNKSWTFSNPPATAAGTKFWYERSYYDSNKGIYNTHIGVGYRTGRESSGDHYSPTINFYPSDIWSAEQLKYFFFRMTGFWDYDDDWGDGYWMGQSSINYGGDIGDDFSNKSGGDGLIFYAPANYGVVETEELTFKHGADGKIAFSRNNVKTYSIWTAHYGFTFSDANPGNFLTKGYDAGTFEVKNGEVSGSISMPDGWDPTKPYTLYYHKYLTRTQSVSGYTVNQGIDGTIQELKMPGFIYPTNLEYTPEKWNERIVLKWSVANDDGAHDSAGKWYIFRKAEGESGYTKLDAVVKGQTNYTDNDVEMDKQYSYCVTFVPDLFGEISEPHNSKLTAETTASVNRSFTFPETKAITTTHGNGGIIITWTAEKDGHEVKLQKFDESSNQWNDIYVGTASSYTDEDVVSLATYKYRVKATHWERDFYSKEIEITYMEMSEISSVTASQGLYTNMVKVNWAVKQLGTSQTRFVVSRRLLTAPNSVYSDIYEVLGTASSYYFEDVSAQAGQYYYYKVTAYAKHPTTGGWTKGNSLEADGFNVANGIISGRVAYGSGTAVSDVTVRLSKNTDDDDNTPQFFAYQSTDASGVLSWQPREEFAETYLAGKPFTVQCWARADLGRQNTDELPVISIGNQVSVVLGSADEDGFRPVMLVVSGQAQNTGLKAQDDKYYNYSLACNGTNYQVMMSDADVNIEENKRIQQFTTTGNAINWNPDSDYATLRIAADAEGTNSFIGNVDDIRVWNRVLSYKEVLRYYNRILSGSEAGLLCYWPLDEGVSGIPYAYDYSKTNGIINGNHATLSKYAVVTSSVPTQSQLSLYGETDEQGNYTIRGVPFSGEGTSYTITPILGVHEFNPHYSSRYISNSSLTHSAVDFSDVSSFPVSGTVLYEGTTIPVEGIQLMVDGIPAARDGKAITTNNKGEFNVDVPIGDHFISLSKNGHTFVADGRFPADPDGVGHRYTFEKAMSGLKLWDNTKVSVGGRVAGGNIENDKPVGVGAGKANLGKAVVNLTFNGSDRYYINAKEVVNGLVTSYEQSDEQHDFAQASDSVKSKAYVQGGKNFITIETDPRTGEWAAMLPPLKYEAQSITIPSQPELDFTSKLGTIDASNAMMVLTDSIETNQPGTDGYARFNHTALYKVAYYSESSFDVVQEDNGAFGEKEYAATTINGLDTIPLYTVNKADGTIDYAFDAPVFVQYHKYRFKIRGYEQYVNKDDAEPVIDKVPLAGLKVTVKNEMALSTSVVLATGEVHQVEGDEFDLDSVGCANYVFTAGLPNLQAPYHRTMAFSYNIDGTELQWKGNGNFKAIVAGMLPQGNDFVTEGPDKPLMILRDPPGTASSATWARGHSKSTVTTYNNSINTGAGTNTTTKFGAKLATFEGLGFGFITEAESKCELDVGLEANYTYDHENTLSMTTTTTTEISTSDAPDYVGAAGDVYIGVSTNVVLGQCKDLSIKKDEVTGEYGFSVDDILMSSEQFTTSFNYTQAYIEGSLIPNLEKQRDNLLVQVADVNSVARPAAGKDPLYVTTLSPDDKNFGTSNSDKAVWGDKAVTFGGTDLFKAGRWNGPSYSVILPVDCQDFSDKVQYYNSQVRNWQNMIARNEEAKVEAIRHRDNRDWLIENYSFDSGSKVTYSVEKDTTRSVMDTNGFELNLSSAQRFGASFNGTGVDFEISEHVNEAASWGHGWDESNNASFTFNLAEDGNNDYLSVDVLNDKKYNYSPIFYTRAGATSGPYEDEVVTSYYKPGTVIQQKTLQIEKPEMSVLDPLVTGVPAGKEAKVRIKLRNMSETQSGLYYGLKVMPATNPNGAQIFMDGKNIATGVDILLQGGEEIQKTLTIRQSDEDILEYKDIVLRMYSLTQPEDGTGNFPGIYSDQTVSVFFQPSCTDIDLASTATLVNTDSDTPITFSMSGYDYNQASFQEIRLQYKGENDANFRNLQVFVKDEKRLAGDPNLKLFKALSGTEKLTCQFDLRSSDYSDQTYVFRAQTVGSRGGDEVTNESQEIRIVRDMNRPQLITNPTPANGVLTAGGNITLTFNEDINQGILTKTGNFIVTGKMNETEVAHDVALDLTGTGAAKTTATINLAQRPFAASMWLNYTTDGTILQHGTTGNSFTASIRDGKLVLAIGDKEVVSTQSLPTGKWVFLAMNYDNSDETPRVSASYALDADIVNLFTGNEFAPYEGNGPLTIGGNGLKAKVQEVALWNEARNIEDALADRAKTKNPYTSGLIGYWQLGEGHGLTATDRARSRDLTLPAENAWYVGSGVNYAARLDGQTAIESPVSTTATADDSYMVELWFNVAAKKAASQTIVSLGNKMDVSVNEKGQVVTTINGTSTTAYAADLCDGQWHHMAINVLKGSNGSATLYIDGQARRQFSASQMPTLGGAAHIVLGAREKAEAHAYDQFMTGSVDEVRVWNGRRTADVVKNMMYQRVENDAEGLEAYYPMEVRSLDDYGQVQTQSSAKNMKGNSALNMNGLDAEGFNKAFLFGTEAPALASAPALENVQFDFVASERQITINLGEEPYKMENCNVNLTVKNVKDLNGNAAQPVSWTIFVQQNQLKWVENDVEIETVNGEAETFTVEIENHGATSDSWTLKDMPAWLTASTESGNLAPQASQKLRFTVDPSTAVGNYEATVFLTGSQNIDAPLNITLKVKGEEPVWTPMPDEETMNIVAQVKVDGVVCADPDDILGAFRGQECVGVAKPVYSARYDAYFVMMNVYGNAATDGAALSYKFYDASTGTVYPAVTSSKKEAYTFKANTMVGSFGDDWTIFMPENKIEQDLSLDRSGWKWFSMYVTPEDASAAAVFADAEGKVDAVKSEQSSTFCKDGKWMGSLTLETQAMYKLQASDAYQETVIGTPANPAQVEISLTPEGWTWMGYPVTASNNLASAFADAEPQDGDIVKSQSLFAMYVDGGWIGSLTAMTPGEGYMYYSNAAGQKTFHFQAPASGQKRVARKAQTDVLWLTAESNMSVVASVMMDGQLVEDAVISVYAGDELCGYSAAADQDGRHFLTVGGKAKGSQKLRFVVEAEGERYELDGLMDFRADTVMGTPKSPVTLNLDQETAVKGLAAKDIDRIEYFDLNGRLLLSDDAPAGLAQSQQLNGVQVALKRVIYADGTVKVFKTME